MTEKTASKRFSADSLRAISKETSQKKRAQTTLNKHRASLWAQLVASASEGLFARNLENLNEQDVSFLRETGLYVAEKFMRVTKRHIIESQIEKLKADYKALVLPRSKAIHKSESPDDQMDLIAQVTSQNQGLAFMTGLDEWFGDDFSGLYLETIDEASAFLNHLEHSNSKSIDPEKRAFLNQLIPLARKLHALMVGEQDSEQALELKTTALADRFQDLENSDDFTYDESIVSIHEVDWGSCDSWKPVNGFNSYDLFWLSSRQGQNFLSEAESRIVQAASNGKKKIVFDAVEAQNFKHVNDIDRFDHFKYQTDGHTLAHLGPCPELFALTVQLGGSKAEVSFNKDESYTITVNW